MSKPLIESELREKIDKKLKTAYELARAATATEEGRKAIDFFYHVHLNSYPGFAYDLILKELQAYGEYVLQSKGGDDTLELCKHHKKNGDQ